MLRQASEVVSAYTRIQRALGAWLVHADLQESRGASAVEQQPQVSNGRVNDGMGRNNECAEDMEKRETKMGGE